MIPTLTADMLAEYKPCSGQFAKWKQMFPDGMKLTKANWDKVIKSEVSHEFAEGMLRGSALAEYKKVHDPAWAEYRKVRAPALAEYEKVRDSALAEYKKVRAPALLVALRATVEELKREVG